MHQERLAYPGHTGFNLQYRCQVKQMNSINSNAPRKTCLSRGFNHLFTFFWPYWLKSALQMLGETEINSINSIKPRKTCLSRVFDHFFFHKQLRMVQ